jgi:2',3'-cyclic-nucleotide 2'-phosphodiesterase (5'-nucleotidase family)
MLGGLSKKATYLDQYRKEHGEIITVDSGDLLNEYLEIKESVKKSVFLKADLTARAFKQIGIDAVNVGELDLVLGLDYLRELEANYGIPFVSASLVDGSGKLVFKPYVIKDIGKIRVTPLTLFPILIRLQEGV